MRICCFYRTPIIYVNLTLLLYFSVLTRAQDALIGATTSEPMQPSLSRPLAQIKPKRLEFKGAREQFEVKRLPPLPESKGMIEDKSQQTQATKPSRFEVVHRFPGLKVSNNKGDLAPPDSSGAAGVTQYVQWVNQTITVFGKDGSVKYPPADGNTIRTGADGNTIWTGFGGPCEEWNDGDPIVLFDRLKGKNNQDGRWILSQFAVAYGPPYYQCIAISETNDALGRYFRYAFKFELFNDYPKIGVWTNAYYATFNMFKDLKRKDQFGNEVFKFINPRVCALERDKMLQGLPARMQCFNPASRSMLPADVDGSLPPPPDSPGVFMDYTVGAVRIWQMNVNWQDPTRSTLSAPKEIPTEPFAEACYSKGCISQPKTDQKLDASGDRLMFRLAYRRFEGPDPHEALVVNHTVRVDAQDKQAPDSQVAGIRWYELRRSPGRPWTIKQQGTYVPDISTKAPSSRWAGSIAMDGCGNILLGYSKSSPNVYPSIFLTGWSPKEDAPRQLEGEREVQPGKGSVLPSDRDMYRWGDYSSMTLDPDDGTFWFTSEYQAANKSYAWETYIFNVRFSQDCKTSGGADGVSQRKLNP